MSITLSTCFYVMKSKFDASIYVEWMNHFFSIVNHFHLVVYTDASSALFIDPKWSENPRILVVLRPVNNFYLQKYRDKWITNHERNMFLKDRIDWEVNMLWSEKLWFVKETIEQHYLPPTSSGMYGWCDIGYFRNRPCDIPISHLQHWANPEKRGTLDNTKIAYACVNNHAPFLRELIAYIRNKNEKGLPVQPIPPMQVSIGGGFFVLQAPLMDGWAATYEAKLALYFQEGYLVKDDQIVLADCIFSEMERFSLFQERDPRWDNWFMFQRILL